MGQKKRDRTEQYYREFYKTTARHLIEEFKRKKPLTTEDIKHAIATM